MLNAALSALPLPIILAASGVGLLATPWLIRLPKYALAVLLLSLVVGQTVRLPLPGQGGGLLASDIAVVLVLLTALFQIFSSRISFGKHKLQNTNNKQNPKPKNTDSHHASSVCALCFENRALFGVFVQSVFWLLTPFILWSLFVLILNTPALGLPSAGIALTYWLRLASHLLLLPALLILFQDAKQVAFARRGLLLATALLVLLGFLQLWLIPDLSRPVGLALRSFSEGGWDPHQGRLVSTWLDPNFFGAFLAIMMPFVLVLHAKHRRTQIPDRTQNSKTQITKTNSEFVLCAPGSELCLGYVRICVLCILFIALLLTQSRSALVAATLASLIVSPLAIGRFLQRAHGARHLLAVSLVALVMVLALASSALLVPRLIGLVSLDATVMLRANALRATWQLAQDNTWLGVGYNAYQFAAQKAGLIGDFTVHSRAGADNSVLTLWVTTGLLGVLLFLLPWVFVAHLLLRRYRTHSSISALAVLMSLATLIIHSQFVNSFLYAHLLIVIVILVAVALAEQS